MTTHTNHALCALAAMALLHASPAQASEARVMLENIKFTFVDLDADDGVTPYFHADGGKAYSTLYQCTNGVCPDFWESQPYSYNGLLMPGTPALESHPLPWITHYFGADHFGIGVRSDADAHSFHGDFPLGFYSWHGYGGTAEFSDHTLLTISGDLAAYAQGIASSGISLQLMWDLSSYGLGRVTSDTFQVGTQGEGRYSVPFSFSVRNDAPWPVRGELWLRISAQGSAAPIPEPAGAALLGAGSLLLAAAVRRRRAG